MSFLKNSCKNRTDKFVNVEPLECDAADVSLNFKCSWFILTSEEEIPTLYPVTPLKPRIHPVNVVDVIPVYDIISSLIFNRPYSDGNPFVLGTVIVSSVDEISDEIVVVPTMT